MFRKTHHIHFVGIGGIGMSGIAEVLLHMGYAVSGSDLAASRVTRRLEGLGAKISIGHDAAHIKGADVLVLSAAIGPDNPESIAARANFVPVIPRAEMLAELMRPKFGIAIGGTHGKTTTTSLVATVLGAAKFDPTIVIGGRLDSLGTNAKLGASEYMVAEADESDGSFLLLSPTISVITNIDPEHMDYYTSIDHLKRTFELFANKIPFYGATILCIDHENVQSLIPKIHKRYVTYGFSKQADLSAVDITQKNFSARFTVTHADAGKLGSIEIGMPGHHNILNTLAAVAVSLELDISFNVIAEALQGFSGVHRRFDPVGEAKGILVIDDYGHHPEEIKNTLATAKACFDRRVVAVFQPHRYTRTRDRYDEFLTAFNEADLLLMTDIYPASETPIEGVTAQKLFDGIRACGHKNVHFEPDKSKLADRLHELTEPGDLVITLGAGDITKVSKQFYAALCEKSDHE